MADDRLQRTHALGQSIWYDNIRRGLLRSGALADLVKRGVRGLTSNPTIFEKAIVASGDYEADLRQLVADGRSTLEIYETSRSRTSRPRAICCCRCSNPAAASTDARRSRSCPSWRPRPKRRCRRGCDWPPRSRVPT